MATAAPKYRVGLVGLGEISSYFINGITLNPHTELVAVCRRTKRPEDDEKYKGIKFYTDWKDLVDDKDVNLIVIATPPSNHHEVTKRALPLKKKVITEKPYSLQLSDGYEAIKLANEHQTHINFAYHAALNPLSLQAKQKIQEALNAGDKIASFKVTFAEDVRNYHGNNSWIFESSISGGGCLIDSGINAISVVQHIGVGQTKPVKVELGHKPESGIKVEISAHVEFVSIHDPSVKGELNQEWLHTGSEKREIQVHFKSGKAISFDYAVGSVVIKHEDGKTEEHKEKLETAADHHNTPMGHEYVNIINFAVKGFENEKEYIDELGIGPFETIMQCYDLAKQTK